ncbi:corticotropin-releasing factor-binding protein [Trichonephila clavata]|uniref:Corticotropin-releasing factor-binding protein n=1 Tax=Trichonephila clavata TaxID=2740835 RepID=A0A8X6IB10_TRICU|nr:corticotropin-releasing factor-binding protein [Trichonephila clavata]
MSAAFLKITESFSKQSLNLYFFTVPKEGIHDYVEIRGGDGLDPNLMKVAIDYCGLKSLPSAHPISVACGNTAVRLVSSGHFENSVTFSFDIPADFSSLDLVCPSFLESF